MKRVVSIGGIVVMALATAWLGWRWATTPVVPDVPLDGLEVAVVELIEEARQEVRRQPRSGETWGKLGMILAVNNLGDWARGCFRHAERFEPENPAWPYFHGMLLSAARGLDGLPYFERALMLAKAPDERAAVLYRLAIIQIEDNQLERADHALKALADVEPDSPQWRLAAGLRAVAGNDRAAARRHLAELLEHPCAARQAHQLLATQYPDAPAESRRLQERLGSLPIDLPWPDVFVRQMQPYHVNRGAQLRKLAEHGRQGRLDDARELYRQLTAKGPDADACIALTDILVENGFLSEAEEVLQAALRADPRQARPRFRLGVTWLHQGESLLARPDKKEMARAFFAQALDAFDRVIALQGDDADAHVKRGRALTFLGRIQDAEAALAKALVLRPEFAEAQWAMGELRAEAGNLPEALRHFEEAFRLAAPDNARLRAALDQWRRKAQR